MKIESAKVLQVGDTESPDNIYLECLVTGDHFRIQLITDIDLTKYGVVRFKRHPNSDSIATIVSFSSFLFYRSFDFLYRTNLSNKKDSVAFDGTVFLTPEEVLEKLGLVITEDIRFLIPDFMECLERNYVDYEPGVKAQLACENYVDNVIRYFRYELVEKPLVNRP